MHIFLLDDEANKAPRNQIGMIFADHTFTVATSCEEGRNKFQGQYDLVLLDHDMRGFFETDLSYPNTGFMFASWMVSRYLVNKDFVNLKKPPIFLHSQNSAGRMRMASLLRLHQFPIKECPFGFDYLNMLREIAKEANEKASTQKPTVKPTDDEDLSGYCC